MFCGFAVHVTDASTGKSPDEVNAMFGHAIDYERVWNGLSYTQQSSIIRCGRAQYYPADGGPGVSWRTLTVEQRNRLIEVDWEFALGKELATR